MITSIDISSIRLMLSAFRLLSLTTLPAEKTEKHVDNYRYYVSILQIYVLKYLDQMQS